MRLPTIGEILRDTKCAVNAWREQFDDGVSVRRRVGSMLDKVFDSAILNEIGVKKDWDGYRFKRHDSRNDAIRREIAKSAEDFARNFVGDIGIPVLRKSDKRSIEREFRDCITEECMKLAHKRALEAAGPVFEAMLAEDGDAIAKLLGDLEP